LTHQLYMYSDPWYDAAASVFIASSVVVGSSALLTKTAKALVGETLPVDVVDYLIFKLEEDVMINSVHDVKTEVARNPNPIECCAELTVEHGFCQVLGVDTVRFKAEIEFNAEAITRKTMNLYEIPSPESAQLLEVPPQPFSRQSLLHLNHSYPPLLVVPVAIETRF
jgi:hypothetical protein